MLGIIILVKQRNTAPKGHGLHPEAGSGPRP